MSIVQYFSNSEVRFVDHPEGKFEFGIVADDLAVVLEASSGKDIARYVDDDWKGALSQRTPGGTQTMTVIWEPGIYQLLAKSRKPQAKPFQKWLFEEVLPTIRFSGSYSIKEKTTGDMLVEMAIAYRDQEKRLAEVETTLMRHNAELDRISHPDGHFYTVLGYANILGLSLTSKEANSLGRRCAAISRSRQIPIHKAGDSKYGQINQYLDQILEEVFATT